MIALAVSFVRSYFALLVVAAAFVWAALTIALYRQEEAPPGTKVLRIGHWQLEAGVTAGFKELAEEYQKLHPDVRIIEDRIPESVYGQWVTTNLMGGTAPDMIEIGFLPYHVWISYFNRYFVPISRNVNQPNPYNAGTEFEKTPWRMTYKDGMRTSYVEEMGEYMSVPLSQFSVRIFYNKDLLKKLTGLDRAPGEYRAFLDVCEKIKSRKDATGRAYTPIVGSKYHFNPWDYMMFNVLTYPAVRKADFDRNGFVGVDELFVAFRTGRIDFSFPPYKAKFQMIREIAGNMQTGYTGLTRDEGLFLFAQQRAVFITTGTWDALSLQQQAENRFEVAAMDFPLPAKDDPVYGPIIEGPVYENPMAGFRFGITRTCKYPDVALDFLLFISGKTGNEKLNEIIGWIPAILHTKKAKLLEGFEPHLEGIYPAMDFNLGGETLIAWQQLYSLYQVNQITYEDLAKQFEPIYREKGLKDFMEMQKDWRRAILKNEQYLATVRARAMGESGIESTSYWVRYRALIAGRQVRQEINHERQMRMLERGPTLEAGPYEYGPRTIERIRKRLKESRQ